MEEKTLDYKKIASKVLAGVLAVGLAVPAGIGWGPDMVQADEVAPVTVYMNYFESGANGGYAEEKKNGAVGVYDDTHVTSDDTGNAYGTGTWKILEGLRDNALETLEDHSSKNTSIKLLGFVDANTNGV